VHSEATVASRGTDARVLASLMGHVRCALRQLKHPGGTHALCLPLAPSAPATHGALRSRSFLSLRALVSLSSQNATGGSSASARTSAKLGTTLVALMRDPNAEVRRSAVKAAKRFAKQCPGMGGRAMEVSQASLHTTAHTCWPWLAGGGVLRLPACLPACVHRALPDTHLHTPACNSYTLHDTLR
jgi:hypothetical protein